MALGRTHIVAPLGATDTERKLVQRTNVALRALDRRKPIATPSVFLDNQSRPAAEDSQGRIIFVRQANGTVQGQYSDGTAWQTFLATSVSFALPTITYATTPSAGTLGTTLRSDSVLRFPSAVMSSANSSTLTLTDDATNQTLTGNLGRLYIATTEDVLILPTRIAIGSDVRADASCTFEGTTLVNGNFMRVGLEGGISANDSTAYSNTEFFGGILRVATIGSNGATYTNVNTYGLRIEPTPTTFSSGTHTFGNRDGLHFNGTGLALQSGTGVVTTTTVSRIRTSTWPVIGNPGTSTNGYELLLNMPTVGSTIRRGVSLATSTSNIGTEAANVEGFYCEDIGRGTSRRVNYYAEGATAGTPTDVYAYYQGTAHVVGTNRYGFRATGATTGTPTLCVGFYADAHSVGTTQWAFYSAGDESHMVGVQQDDNAKDVFGTGRDAEIYYDGTNLIIDPDVVGSGEAQIAGKAHVTGEAEIDGALNHDGTTVGFYAVAPTTRSAAYTPTNVTTDRAYDANATTVDELADVLGTLIADLQLTGIIG